jgi:predicted Zn finger-like uncharacterized protein
MPISVKCPDCDTAYKVPDEAAGKAIKCKKCGAKVPVPAPGGGDDDLSNLGGNGDAGGDTKAKKKGGSGKILAIVGGLLAVSCCLCVGIGGGGAYYFYYVAAKTVNEGFKDAFKDLGKDMPKEKIIFGPKDKAVVAGGATILEKKETLTTKDAAVNGKPAKTYKVKLDAGKEYIIDMKATGKGFGHDPYLILLDPGNKEVAKDDDSGGGLDAQIRYTPAVSGDFTIQATCLAGVLPEGLPFSLTVKLK